VKREFSAGGVVLRPGPGGDEVAVVSPRDGVLALPKGHPDGDETLEQAASREVREEAGLTVRAVDRLGDVRYWYTLKGERVLKTVTFFLFDYVSGDTADHDDEVVWAGWIPLADAVKDLSYRGERSMAVKALERPAASQTK
jgi:8-oxo-dGTP diphosphatase